MVELGGQSTLYNWRLDFQISEQAGVFLYKASDRPQPGWCQLPPCCLFFSVCIQLMVRLQWEFTRPPPSLLMRLYPGVINLCLLLQLQTFLILFFFLSNLLYLSVLPNTPAVLSPEVYHAFLLFFFKENNHFSLFSSPLLSPWVLLFFFFFPTVPGSQVLFPMSDLLNSNIAKETS